FLTMQDAYFNEEIRGLIESLCPQVHMIGGGVIGQVAFTKNHQWMCLENHNRQQSSSNSIRDMFLACVFGGTIEGTRLVPVALANDFGPLLQTIAAIPVEPQGVVQFGSTKKISEAVEFVNQAKRMFQETMNHGVFEDADPVGPTCSSACPVEPYSLSSSSQSLLIDHNRADNMLQSNNIFTQCTSGVSNSSLVSFNESLASESGGLEPWNSFPTQSNGHDLFDSLPNFGIPDDFDTSQWIPPFPGQNQEPLSMNSEGKGGDLMPMIDESQLNFHHQKLNKQVGIDSITPDSTKGLLSKLRIDELFEGNSGTSHAASTTAKRRKAGNSIWEMSTLPTVLHKSELGMCMDNGYGMNNLSTSSQAKNRAEPSKAAKKKAKPGTRPRPKDRQQILDRMAELRELIPNDEPKKNKDNDPYSSDATWAYEVGNQTMACPLIVEDLSTPGQMLIEMLCEDRGFFLEMVDVIKGFGVIILKGVMETRDKIWARFIVEAEAKRHVTRHDIFASLVQFLQASCLDDNHVRNAIMEEKNRKFPWYVHRLKATYAICRLKDNSLIVSMWDLVGVS
ncbi:hypothetical protein M8C21_014543, partial [Ambrosia artemisiifolia]